MPTFEGGGRVKDTYGLRNAAEQLRERGRGDDTILAHINPEEAGILKLLGGSGTINPYTGLPEYSIRKILKKTPIVKDIYKVGSSIGKEIERGVESIAKDKILGPIAQFATAFYGGPIGSAIYAGLAPEGSSFDTKRAIRAGATTAAFNAMSAPDSNVFTPRGSITDLFGSGMQQVPVEGISSVAESAPSVLESIGGTMDAAGSANIPGEIGSLESAVSPIAYTPPTPDSYFGGADAINQYASAPMNAPVTDSGLGSLPKVTPERLPTSSEQYFDNMMGQPAPYADVGEVPTFDYGRAASDISEASADPNAFQKGINTLKQGYSDVKQGISNIIPEPVKDAYDVVKDYLPDRQDIRDAAGITSLGTTVYGAYKTKQELDAQKAEAERVLADQANRTKEEIEFAQSVLRDYPYNYQRLTEEDIRRERGMAMGGRINSYDDEPGMDDGMMQGGIAALAKGGLPPRYLRGGGDGMSDSIRARIGGKQEARLADGEFVVPADVVSHLGNGSSNAGAKKLYAMMNRIRKSRTGKTRQAPEVNTRRLMPA
jgi:hypothetical protein